jgi:hypothetical protein
MHPLLRSFQAVTTRLGLSHRLGSTHDGLRQMEEVLGYKDTLTYRDFKRAYIRNDLAKRIVNTWPNATWSQPPLVYDDQDNDVDTPFELAWQALEKRLAIYRNLRLIDRLAQLGHYGCLLIGLRGQPLLSQPAQAVRSPDDVLFLQPYSEELLTVETFGTDAGDPLYGKPQTYRLVGGATSDTTDMGLRRPTHAGVIVHASRVLHMPGEDGLDDPDIYGQPILEAVYNKLVDLMKVVGGSAEMFWRDAKRRIALEVQEGYTLSPDAAAQLTQEAEEYQHGLRDFLRLMGVQAKDLSGTVSSPKEHFETIMQCIAGTVKIPTRILLGSERGELASSQDEDAYLREVAQREVNYAQPRGLDPLIERFIALRILPPPRNEEWVVTWPNVWTLSEQAQATIMKDRAAAVKSVTGALVDYRGPGMGDTLVSPEEIRGLLATVWQGSELELTPELPPEVEEQLLLSAPLEEPEPPEAEPATAPPANDEAA